MYYQSQFDLNLLEPPAFNTALYGSYSAAIRLQLSTQLSLNITFRCHATRGRISRFSNASQGYNLRRNIQLYFETTVQRSRQPLYEQGTFGLGHAATRPNSSFCRPLPSWIFDGNRVMASITVAIEFGGDGVVVLLYGNPHGDRQACICQL